MSACTLYRHFDANGKLLYVGISNQPFTRLKAHQQHSGWFSRIARVDLQTFFDLESARRAERDAIKSEQPEFNKAHIPRPSGPKKIYARGVSLPLDMEKAAIQKALKLDIYFSKYIQRLIRADLEKGIIA